MKLITHKKQVIGIAADATRNAASRFVCPTWTSKAKDHIDACLKAHTELTLSFLVYVPSEGEPQLIEFAAPLSFKLERIKTRVTQVTQPDLPLRTTADPATLLNDIAYEVLELVRVAHNPAYSHPEYARAVARLRSFVSVTSLGLALDDSP
jgi:hypothetical protein